MPRPTLRELISAVPLGVAFFVLVTASVQLTRFEGGVAFVWVAAALLGARLSSLPLARWAAPLATCWIGGLVAGAIFGFGPAAAPFMAAVNVAEPALGAWLLRRHTRQRSCFETVEGVAWFTLIAGVLAPAASGFAGAAIAHLATGTPYWSNWLHWCAGHGLGTIAFAPIFALAFRGEIGGWARRVTAARAIRTVGLLALVAAVALVVFGQEAMPLLFLPLLPMMLATLGLGRFGAAASTVVITLIGGWLTVRGHGPIQLLRGGGAVQIEFFQFYIATAAMLVLPVAALLKQRQALFVRIAESESRFRLLADHSGDAICRLSAEGTILYASPGFERLAGLRPEALIGHSPLELIEPDDHAAVIAAHHRSLADPAGIVTTEYRVRDAGGELRWFEASNHAVVEQGRAIGVISAIRDMSARRALQDQLAVAASTDALTGLANRRAFMARLDEVSRAAEVRAAVAIIDLDHFKAVNDRFGHASGDVVLAGFAKVAGAMVRAGDMLARIGGEEFGLLLPDASLAQAEEIGERIRRAVAAARFAADDGRALGVTVSVGVAALRPDGGAAALAAADAALYQAKAEGRDRLRLAA